MNDQKCVDNLSNAYYRLERIKDAGFYYVVVRKSDYSGKQYELFDSGFCSNYDAYLFCDSLNASLQSDDYCVMEIGELSRFIHYKKSLLVEDV